MKILAKEKTKMVSGGTQNQEAFQVQNGYLTSTLHIPPHSQALMLELLFELPNDLIKNIQS